VTEGTEGEEREGNGEGGKKVGEGGERRGKGRGILVPDWETEKVATLLLYIRIITIIVKIIITII